MSGMGWVLAAHVSVNSKLVFVGVMGRCVGCRGSELMVAIDQS